MDEVRFSMSGSRRIILLNYEFPPLGGGAANATLFFGRALVTLGHRPTVITSGLRNEHRCSDEDGVRVHRLRTNRPAADRSSVKDMISYMIAAARHAPCIARAEKADAIIAFFTIPSGVVARWLTLQLDLPYIVSLRGSDVPGHDRTLNRMHAITLPLRRCVLRNAIAVVANSDGLAATARAADPFPIQIIPNGVDCDRFNPDPNCSVRSPNAPLRILFVGRVHREKNLGSVIRQLSKLPAGIRARIELLVAGDGAQRPELFGLASELGVADQVRWLGWQSKASLPALYRTAHALVNPSLYEGMPNVVLEAMASALPVIASDIPGNRAVVVADKTGLFFPLDDEAVLGSALSRLFHEPRLASDFGRAGRHRAERDFSWTSAAQSYLELLPKPSAKFPTP